RPARAAGDPRNTRWTCTPAAVRSRFLSSTPSHGTLRTGWSNGGRSSGAGSLRPEEPCPATPEPRPAAPVGPSPSPDPDSPDFASPRPCPRGGAPPSEDPEDGTAGLASPCAVPCAEPQDQRRALARVRA